MIDLEYKQDMSKQLGPLSVRSMILDRYSIREKPCDLTQHCGESLLLFPTPLGTRALPQDATDSGDLVNNKCYFQLAFDGESTAVSLHLTTL